MARTKAQVIDAQEPRDHIEEQVDDLEQHILAALNATSDDVHFKLSVCRVNQNNAREERIGSFPPTQDIDPFLDELAAKYGSGTYRFRLYRNGVISTQTDRDLLAPPAPAAPAPTNASDIAGAIAQAMAKPMELITQLIAQQQQQPRGRETPITDLVSALSQLDNLRGGRQQAPETIGPEKALELVKMGMEFAQEAGGGGRSSSFMSIMEKVVEKMDWAKLAEAMTPHAPLAALPQARPAAPGLHAPATLPQTLPRQDAAPAPQANGTVSPQEQAATNLQVMLQHNLRYLCQKAAAQADTELYAEWCYDNIPTDILSALMNTPDVVGTLQQVLPDVGAYADWFMELAEDVRAILTEVAQQANSNVPPKGDAPHVHGPSVANPPRSE